MQVASQSLFAAQQELRRTNPSHGVSRPFAIRQRAFLRSSVPWWLLVLGLLFGLLSDRAWAQPTLLGPPATQIVAGDSHTCALTSAGVVQCWGSNAFGQLGTGNATPSATPVTVANLPSGVVAITAGQYHTCALTGAGAVWCWGNDIFGQLGDGGFYFSTTPVAVSGLASGVAAITAGANHTCALSSAGAVQCWGKNSYGQLGNGRSIDSSTPVAVSGLASGAATITAGANHTCALTSAGAVQCWGNGYSGQLGNGSSGIGIKSSTPVTVSGLASGVATITAGADHTCALTSAGAVQCWGRNGGRLGDGGFTDSSIPVAVSGLTSGVAAITAGSGHTCALAVVGAVQCWGDNAYGQLGISNQGSSGSGSSLTPVAVAGLASDTAAITTGGSHTCALSSIGTVQCWGGNGSGQLGNGGRTNSSTPLAVAGLANRVATITAGANHTCALTSAGGVWCWGRNDLGALGNGSSTFGQTFNGSFADSSTPVAVLGMTSGVVAITAGYEHTCALTSAGGVWCWGSHRQLGNGSNTDSSTPVPVSGLGSGVVAITAGPYHTCALIGTGAAKCWGDNSYGQLGNNSKTYSSTPVAVSGLTSGLVAIAAGWFHTCALTSGGAVQCWGLNVQGQLGDGSTTDSLTPVQVSNLTNGVVSIAAGLLHTCALTSTGAAQCWGNNAQGELGNGTGTNSSTPVAVAGMSSGVASITAGRYHTCALTSVGAAQCWGYNYYGQLGDGSTTDSSTPVVVSGLASGLAAITAGDSHTCVLTSTGALQCWGYNRYGQLGNGGNANLLTPMAVSSLTSGVAAIAAGGIHSCAVTSAGAAQCWGDNSSGELGNGGTSNSSMPVPVSGLASGVAAVTAGYSHSCALTSAGAVLCWGRNSNGQLGNGLTSVSNTPVPVTGLVSGVAAIAAGSSHSCVLTGAGAVLCWGYNATGQLGNGSINQSSTPVAVLGLGTGMAAISAGDLHTCALTSAGAVLCWGGNGIGQLGNGSITNSYGPVAVSGLGLGVAAIAAGGYHTCALTSSGGVLCWGRNREGQLGNGGTTDSSTPVAVPGLTSGVAAIAAGDFHTCAVTSAGAVLCWGSNQFGQLGNGGSTDSSTPVAVTGLSSPVAMIAAGDGHTCAITSSGAAQCWGENRYGELGNGVLAPPILLGQSVAFNPPTPRLPLTNIASGGSLTLAATASSGLASSFDVWTPGTCSVVGNVLTANGPTGSLCGVRASQAGISANAGGTTAPAPQQLRLLWIGSNYTIATTASPAAGGSVTCAPNPAGQGFTSTCTASANPGYTFSAFSGDCAGATCVLANIQSNKTVTATFAVGPAVSLSPATLTFADQLIGTTSPVQSVTLTNTGSTVLNITSIASTVNVFALSHNCGASLPAGGSCNLNIAFTPTAAGTRVGAISVTSNAAGSPHSVILNGAGVRPNCTSFSLSLDAANPNSSAGVSGAWVIGFPSGCQGSWNASGNGSWLTVSRRIVGLTDWVDVSWTQNTSGALRTGTATIGGNTFTVNQSGSSFPAIAATSDLNNDGLSDILWRNITTGQVFGMLMDVNGTRFNLLAASTFYTEPDTAWKIVGVADFDGDGKADLLWRNDVNGLVYVMLMDGTTIKSGRVVHQETDLAWKIVGTGDFNGDGKADILWRNDVTGQVYEMQMNGTTVTGGAVIHREQDLAWKIVAVADFDDDGKDDILWRNDTTGQVYVMLMNGNLIKSGRIVHREVDLAWKIVGTGDFNGDGMADILWRHDSTGQVYEMQMNGTAVAGGAVIHVEPDPAWKIVAIGDYNGDGKADILYWNATTGELVEMQMRGYDAISIAWIRRTPAGNGWRVLGPWLYANQAGAQPQMQRQARAASGATSQTGTTGALAGTVSNNWPSLSSAKRDRFKPLGGEPVNPGFRLE